MSTVTITAEELFALAQQKVAKRERRTPRGWVPSEKELDALVLEVGRGGDPVADGRMTKGIADKVLCEGAGLFHRARAEMVHIGPGQPRQKLFLTEAGRKRFATLAKDETPLVAPTPVPVSVYRKAMGLEKNAVITEVILTKEVPDVETETVSGTTVTAEEVLSSDNQKEENDTPSENVNIETLSAVSDSEETPTVSDEPKITEVPAEKVPSKPRTKKESLAAARSAKE